MAASIQPNAKQKTRHQAVKTTRRFRAWDVILLDPFRWEYVRRRNPSSELGRLVAQDLKAVFECSVPAEDADTNGLLLDEVELLRELADWAWSQFGGGECLISIAVTDRATETSPGELRRLLIEAVLHRQSMPIGAPQRIEDLSGPSLPDAGWWHEAEAGRFSVGLVSLPRGWDAERSGWEWVKTEYGPAWSHASACWLTQYVQTAERCLESAVAPKLHDQDQRAIDWAIDAIRETVPFTLLKVRKELEDRRKCGLRKDLLKDACRALDDWYAVLGEWLKDFKPGRTDLPWADASASEVEEITPAAVREARFVCLKLSEPRPDKDSWWQWAIRQVAHSLGALVGAVQQPDVGVAQQPDHWEDWGWLGLGWAIESLAEEQVGERPRETRDWGSWLKKASEISYSLMPNQSPVNITEHGDLRLEAARLRVRLTQLASLDPNERRTAARFYAEKLPTEPVELIIPLLGSIGSLLASGEVKAREARAILLPTVAGLCFSQECSVRKAARDVLFEWQKADAPVRAGLEELSALLTAASLESPSGIRDVGQLVLLGSAKASKVREELRNRAAAGELEVEHHPLVRQLTKVTGETSVEKLQDLLRQFEGLSFGSLEANRTVVNLINDAARAVGHRFRCQQAGCDAAPALLRCRKIAGFREGAFAFDHGTDLGSSNRFHGGYGRFPALDLVPRSDRSRKAALGQNIARGNDVATPLAGAQPLALDLDNTNVHVRSEQERGEKSMEEAAQKDGVKPFTEEELSTKTESSEPAMSARETIERLKELREPREIERFLERFVVGKTWGDLEANYLVATGITDHLRSLNLRVECPNDGEPAVLRCYPATWQKTGSFSFEHRVSGETKRHVGSPVVPKLRIVPAPADPRRKTLPPIS